MNIIEPFLINFEEVKKEPVERDVKEVKGGGEGPDGVKVNAREVVGEGRERGRGVGGMRGIEGGGGRREVEEEEVEGRGVGALLSGSSGSLERSKFVRPKRRALQTSIESESESDMVRKSSSTSQFRFLFYERTERIGWFERPPL